MIQNVVQRMNTFFPLLLRDVISKYLLKCTSKISFFEILLIGSLKLIFSKFKWLKNPTRSLLDFIYFAMEVAFIIAHCFEVLVSVVISSGLRFS